MSPAAYAQIASGAEFVEANYVANPGASRAYVAGICSDAELRLMSARSDRERGIAHSLALTALRAASALAELESGARESVTAYQPEFAARVARAMGRAA